MSHKENQLGLMARAALAVGVFAGFLTAAPALVYAANIGVSPTLIELNAGESVSGIRVTNGDVTEGVSVQARLVRWRQDATGEDVYTPAEGVVASPPVSRIAPNAENLIRLVRTAKTPVVGEEAYRLLIDQLPQPGAQAAGTVAILIRHSVPMFVSGAGAKPAQPQWRIERAVQPSSDQENPPPPRPGWRVVVTNSGDKRLRLASLELRDESGRMVGSRPGLVGYVLGRSTVGFFVEAGEVEAGDSGETLSPDPSPAGGRGEQDAAALRIVVQAEAGAIETALLPVAAP